MKKVHTKYYFNLSDIAPPSGWEQPLYERFVAGMEDLAEVMTRWLPEYDVEAVVWRDTARLIFTRQQPDSEE